MPHADLVDLARVANLRDLGGVSTADGHRVRRGLIYRSAMLNAGNVSLVAQLRGLGIRTVVDLRANQERKDWPTPWEAAGCTDYWCRDHDHDAGNLLRMAEMQGPATATRMRDEMIRIYRVLPFAQRDAYRATFEAIAAGRGPVLFHCAAGKDRTGVLAALILAAAAVPMTAIIEDYLRTKAFDLEAAWRACGVLFAATETLKPIVVADPAYIVAMFDDLTARHGSIDSYLATVLAMDDDARRKLRAALTEPA